MWLNSREKLQKEEKSFAKSKRNILLFSKKFRKSFERKYFLKNDNKMMNIKMTVMIHAVNFYVVNFWYKKLHIMLS